VVEFSGNTKTVGDTVIYKHSIGKCLVHATCTGDGKQRVHGGDMEAWSHGGWRRERRPAEWMGGESKFKTLVIQSGRIR
jgi:hypothetical protein